MSENNWTRQVPDKVGFYWCCRRGKVNMVNVWTYDKGPRPRLFTNEDGACSVNDSEVFGGAQWQGPIQSPLPPEK